jgi:hypothetical protein
VFVMPLRLVVLTLGALLVIAGDCHQSDDSSRQ